MKTALITGVSGQDGAYLSKLLLEKGYQVFGAYRRSASPNLWRLEELGIADQVELLPLELLEYSNIHRALRKAQPDEIYNLAAQSFVGLSFEQPLYSSDVDGMGTARLLEAIREACPQARFYQASTSEMFGKVQATPQDESTPFYPRSPYGVAKLYAHWMTVNYRESYGLHASSGILFNHESPLRGPEFVTRKITIGLARIVHGRQKVLELGNLEARRDWGFAGDYVDGMWRMVQRPKGGDYALATGKTRSIRDFLDAAVAEAGIDLEWKGKGAKAVGIDRRTRQAIVRVNPKFFRPAEVDVLVGDAAKAKTALKWAPKTPFKRLVSMMMDADLQRAADGRLERTV